MTLEKIVANLVDQVERRFYGKYRGFVVDNADPERLGRLKLQVPSVLGAQVVTGWALPCLPYGGMADQGLLCVPEVGAGVWVEFEEGDLEFPIWVGAFWSKPGGASELPHPNQSADGAVVEEPQDPPSCKIFKTRKGHSLQFEDADEAEMVLLYSFVKDKPGHLIVLDKAGIRILDGANDNEVLLSEAGITIREGTHKHIVSCNEQGITITDGVTEGNQIVLAPAKVTITAKEEVAITGKKITLSAEEGLAASGATMKLSASDKLEAVGNPIHLNP